MSQRTTLLFSAALTAFVLIVIGALAAGVGGSGTAPVSEAAAPDTAAYQRQLDQANARLEQANRQLQDAYRRQQELARQLQAQQTQPAQQSAPDQAAQPPADAVGQGATLTPAQAAEAARQTAPGATLLAAPELVDLQGTLAYEVRLDQGLIYVDAASGQILSSNLPVAEGGGWADHERREHGGREHGDEHGWEGHDD